MELIALPNPNATLGDNLVGAGILLVILAVIVIGWINNCRKS